MYKECRKPFFLVSFLSVFWFSILFFPSFLRGCLVCCSFINLGLTVGSYSRTLGWTLMFMNVFQFTTTMYMWKIHYVVILYLIVRKSNSFYTSDGYECKNDFSGLNFINLLSTKEEWFTPPYITALWYCFIITILLNFLLIFPPHPPPAPLAMIFLFLYPSISDECCLSLHHLNVHLHIYSLLLYACCICNLTSSEDDLSCVWETTEIASLARSMG